MMHPLPSMAYVVSDVGNYFFDFFLALLPLLLSYGAYLWMFNDDDLVRKARGKNTVAATLTIGFVLLLVRLMYSTISATDAPLVSQGFLAGLISVPLFLIGCFIWALVSVLREKKTESEEPSQVLPSKPPAPVLPKQWSAPALPEPKVHTGSELFLVLDTQFEQVVQVRRRDYEEGGLPFEQWQGRYDALLQAKQDVQTEELREQARRLDEAVAAGTITHGQYDLRLEELRKKTMQALLKRADRLNSPQKRSVVRQARRKS